MENYTQIRVLGKGAFGAAWLVQRKKDNVQFVAKEVRLAGMKPREKEEAKHEIAMLRKLNHINITKYIDHFEHKGSLFIVMEYANGGDLYSKIKGRKGTRMTESEVMHYFCQICLALMHLHENRILHRDLKTQNIFLTKDGVVKMGDFGISTVLRNTYELKRTVCGTPYYFSPELCLNKPYNNKSDVWALGCILYEMTTLTHAFDGTNMKGLVNKILKGVYAPIHSSYSRDLSNLISSMLKIDPTQRPNIHKIVGLPFFRTHLEKLQGDMKGANAEHRSVVGAGDRQQAQQDAQRRIEADKKARAEREAQLAAREKQMKQQAEDRERQRNERLVAMRQQMDREMQEHQRKLEVIKEQQKAKEDAQMQRRRELEAAAKVRRDADMKAAKERAAKMEQQNRIREQEWERNMQAQQEENRRRQDQRAQQLQQQEFEKKQQEEKAAQDAAQLYRQLRREAAANRARAQELEEANARQQQQQQQQQQQAPPPQAYQQHQQPVQQGYQQQPAPEAPAPARQAMTEEDMAEARKQAYWQMRREAENNKRRLKGLDPLPDEPPAQQSPVQQQAPPQQQYQAPPPQPQYDAQPQQQHQAPPPQQYQAPPAQQQQQQYGALRQMPEQVQQAPPPMPGMGNAEVAKADGYSDDSDDEDRGLRKFLNDDVVAANEETPDLLMSREADYNNVQAAIAAALVNPAPEDQDFEDDAEQNDPTRFVLEGQTLHLPNCFESDPLMARIESLRLFLEASLGDDLFIEIYRALDSADDAGQQTIEDLQRRLPAHQHKYLPVITQLLVCEEFVNQQGNH